MVNETTYTAPLNGFADRVEENANCLAQEINWFAKQVNIRMAAYFSVHKENGQEIKLDSGNQAEEVKGNSVPDISTRKPVHVNFVRRIIRFLFGEKEKIQENKVSAKSYLQETKVDAKSHPKEFTNTIPPDISTNKSVYADFVNYYKLSSEERILLMLVLIPHIQPHLLDVFFTVNKANARGYTEFGGIKANRHSGFLPTIETALFILAGNDLAKRFSLYRLFEPDHIFIAHNIMVLDKGQQSESFCSSAISISDEYIDFFTTGKIRKPQFTMEFPAKQLQTSMNWQDLVVDDFTANQLDELRVWMKHGGKLMNEWGMAKILKPGYKALFYGPPGTGKTLTAALLGKQFGLDVYRIDLSMVVSKYIGETEKNLEKVFKKAENKNWILFFDEADALFGKRTNISDAHDKYANQEIAYLLQRLEEYSGLVILASNMRNNVDEAFTRRLQSIIAFTKPQYKERVRLWENAFSKECVPPSKEEIERLAQQYDLAGGSVINVVQYASLLSLNRGDKNVTTEDLLLGIKKEYRKEGKTL